ncbi:MAG: sulfatase-like hydrolase/transferase [Myxococcales bacterium]|nr:sulfatase-like hydrolase/transferase [Myxococcales bacterium]
MLLAWIAGIGCTPADVTQIDTSGSDGVVTLEIVQHGPFRDLVAHTTPPLAELSWTHNGEPEPSYGTMVPARDVRPGDRFTVTATVGTASTTAEVEIGDPPGGNVLVLLLDDVGVDHVGVYDKNPAAPPTPRIDQLAAEGIRFDNAYASPVCSPTRGILITGRHASRTGLGWIADTGTRDYALPLSATTVAEALDDAWPEPWPTSAVGKWHMAGPQADDLLTHPLDQGFDWYAGTVGNPSYAPGDGYERWEKNVNGVIEDREGYLTTDTVDDVLDRIEAMPEPWFLYVAFNAAHGPWRLPPEELYTIEASPDDDANVKYDAILEALDTEIGRMLDSIDPGVLARTTVITVGDNGSPSQTIDPPLDSERAKHTVFEPGVHVPFIVTGPHVQQPGSTSDALVHVADIFATTLHIAGVPLTGEPEALSVDLPEPVPIDGRSILPQLADPSQPGHTFLFVEGFFPNGPASDRSIDRRALRDHRYKVVRNGDRHYFFDLTDPTQLDDGPELAGALTSEQGAAKARLETELDRLELALQFEGF